MQGIGTKIKKVRELRNFTQEYMAEHLGMSQNGYSRIERNEVEVSLTKLEKIAETLQVPAKDLLDFNEKNILNNFQVGAIGDNAQITYTISPEIKQLYEDKIKLLEEKIAFLENGK